jgi:AacA4 family aminoglycoside N(6')-acetyltransferase
MVIRLRPLQETELPMLHGWLNREHIVQWWNNERPTLEQVRAEYLPQVLASEGVTPYIGLLDGVPFAYVQSYVAMGSGDGWWEDETDPGVRGIDQSIADPALLGRGLGTLLVRATLQHLFADPAVTKVQTDPSPDNARAIRCYEKAGFRRVGIVDTPDGPAVYMLCERRDFEAAAMATAGAAQAGMR